MQFPGVVFKPDCGQGALSYPTFLTTQWTESYLNILETYSVTELERHLFLDTIYFQQDGALAHFSLAASNFLSATFPDRVIGRGSIIHWPARSCNLTSIDFFLWGYIKDIVYAKKSDNLDQLLTRIRRALQNIPIDMCKRTCVTITGRLALCLKRGGAQIY